MNGTIYVIRNTVNDKIYIGQTIQPVQKRFKQHLKLLKSNKNQLIHKAIKKYGKDKFYYEVLETNIGTDEELDYKEQWFIQEYNTITPNGYNLCPGGCAWRRKPSLSSEDVQKAIDMYESGVSSRKIAEELGVEHGSILNELHKAGISVRKKSCGLPDRSSKATREVLDEYYVKQGLTAVQISKILGISDNSVRRQIRKFGIKRIKCA